jgi:hypothetical protein
MRAVVLAIKLPLRARACLSDVAPMNLRDDWLQILKGVLESVGGAFLYRVFVHPWLEPLIRAMRAVCVGLFRRLRSHGKTVPLTGRACAEGTARASLSASPGRPRRAPPSAPTVSATFVPSQPPPPPRGFVNNS